MRTSTRRMTTSLAVGVALVGISAVPALAGEPTPTTMKMAELDWVKTSTDPTHCFVATTCATTYWTARSVDPAPWGYLDLNSGYIKGKAAAKHKIAEVRALYLEAYTATGSSVKYTNKYKAKGKKHKTKIKVISFQDDDVYRKVIFSYDLVKKKNGKLKKRVPTGVMTQVQGAAELGNNLSKKNGKLLKKQVRKLTKVAAKTPMIGPSNAIG